MVIHWTGSRLGGAAFKHFTMVEEKMVCELACRLVVVDFLIAYATPNEVFFLRMLNWADPFEVLPDPAFIIFGGR